MKTRTACQVACTISVCGDQKSPPPPPPKSPPPKSMPPPKSERPPPPPPASPSRSRRIRRRPSCRSQSRRSRRRAARRETAPRGNRRRHGEVAAEPRAEVRRRRVVRDHPPAGHDLALSAARAPARPPGRRPRTPAGPRGAAGRRPFDVAGRRTVARIEETRRPALGRPVPAQDGLGARHVPPAFLERPRHAFELLRACRTVEQRRRRVVTGQCRVVLPLGRRVLLSGLFELLDVVRERDQVVVRGRFHLGKLRPLHAAAAERAQEDECAAGDRENRDQRDPPPPGPRSVVPPWVRAAATRSTKSTSTAVAPRARCVSSACVASSPATPC